MDNMLAHTVQIQHARYNSQELKITFEKMLRSMFEVRLKGHAEKLQAELASQKQGLNTAAKSAVAESAQSLGNKAHYYGTGYCGHWARHKAIVVRDGEWAGVDIAGDLSKPVIAGLDDHWTCVFDNLPKQAEKLKKICEKEGRHFVEQFVPKLEEWPEVCDHARTLGKVMAQGIGVQLSDDVKRFEESLLEQRAGYAENVAAKVKEELSGHLRDAKYSYAGAGSFMGRKDSVTRNMTCMDLQDSVTLPKQRVKEAIDKFGLLTKEMVQKSVDMARECYADFWDDQKERSAEACKVRSALHEAIQAELPVFKQAMDRTRLAGELSQMSVAAT